MGVPVKKEEPSVDTSFLASSTMAGILGSPDKSKKRKR
jgi:hypothetical protein